VVSPGGVDEGREEKVKKLREEDAFETGLVYAKKNSKHSISACRGPFLESGAMPVKRQTSWEKEEQIG